MIKRFYFYHFEKQDREKPKFANGVVIVTSFHEDPEKAWDYVLNDLQNKWGCDKDKLRCLAFNKL